MGKVKVRAVVGIFVPLEVDAASGWILGRHFRDKSIICDLYERRTKTIGLCIRVSYENKS